MKFDFKHTVWARVIVGTEYEQVVLSQLKEGKITTTQDIPYLFPNKGDVVLEHKTLLSTETPLSLERNGRMPTIEVLAENGDVLWDNGIETDDLHKDQIGDIVEFCAEYEKKIRREKTVIKNQGDDHEDRVNFTLHTNKSTKSSLWAGETSYRKLFVLDNEDLRYLYNKYSKIIK